MDGYQLISLKEMLDTIGEERVKAILSNFSCPLNGDAPGDRMQGLAKSDRGWDLLLSVLRPSSPSTTADGHLP